MALAGNEADGDLRRRVDAAERFLHAADAVMVSTPALAERFAGLNARIEVIPNALDERLLPGNLGPLAHISHGPLVLGYMGTQTHDDDLQMILPALQELGKDLSTPLALQIVGGTAHESTWQALRDLPFPVRKLPMPSEQYPQFINWFASTPRWDIALAPLRDTPLNRGKSDIKFLDYSALGTTGIYSKVPAYANSVVHGETGWLVENQTEAWVDGLRQLIESANCGWNWHSVRSVTFMPNVPWHTVSAIGSGCWSRSTMADAQTSVIIPLWNGQSCIADCLDALLIACRTHTAPVEIIVVDNGSADGSAGFVAQSYANAGVRLIRNGQNLGFAGGCNVGLRAATGDYLLLLNQDTVVDPGWVTALVNALSTTGGIVGSLAFFPDGVNVQHAGGIIEWPLGLAHHLGYGEPVTARWRQAGPADFVTAAALGIHRQIIDTVGLFDEEFWPGYYEDADLCYRARAAGFAVWYEPAATLTHQESAAFRQRLPTAWARLGGRLRFCLKHRAPDFFLNEFIPAEMAQRAAVVSGDLDETVALAYLETIPALVALWTKQGVSTAIISAAVKKLHYLYTPLGHGKTGDKFGDKWWQGGDKVANGAKIKPILTVSPYDRVPGIGPLWRGLRRLLHQLVIFYTERQQSEWEEIVQRQQLEIAALRTQLQAQQRMPSP